MPVDKFGRAEYRETSLIEDAPVSSVEGINETFLRRMEEVLLSAQ